MKLEEKVAKAYQLYDELMGKLKEDAVFIPDKVELTLNFSAEHAEALYTEHFTYIPEKNRQKVIEENLQILKDKLERLNMLFKIQIEISVSAIEDGVTAKIKGERSFVLTTIICELLAQLTVRDTLKTLGPALMVRAYTPPLWKGDK